MPGRSGLDIARSFPTGPRPVLVFVTAYEEHALEAFGVQAADYLLKPVSLERLTQAMERIRLLCAAEANMPVLANQPSVTETPKPEPLNRLIVPAGERMIVVQAPLIDWIESAGNYAIIHVGRDTHVLRETLTELDQRLAPARFMRISRSTIVNIDRIRELRSNGSGGHEMVLADGVKLPITRGIREVQHKLETG
jgi:two-component system LytT family response regulator